jgi:WD40 repeat protein
VSCDETGSFAITGHRDGSVKRWSLDNAKATKKLGFTSFPTTRGVECVKIVGDVAFAKTTDARVETFDLKKDASIKSWQLPFSSYRAKAKEANALPCRFGVTSDGKFFACGDNLDTGIVYVYDVQSAELISQLKPLRVTGVVHAVAVADHCRHVFSSYGPGVVWRYEIIPRVDDDNDGGAATNRKGFEAVVKPN